MYVDKFCKIETKIIVYTPLKNIIYIDLLEGDLFQMCLNWLGV